MDVHYYQREEDHYRLMLRYHTVASMMKECERSRSWAYQMIASYPREKAQLVNTRTGKRELAIPRNYVLRYMERVRRGNPYW